MMVVQPAIAQRPATRSRLGGHSIVFCIPIAPRRSATDTSTLSSRRPRGVPPCVHRNGYLAAIAGDAGLWWCRTVASQEGSCTPDRSKLAYLYQRHAPIWPFL